MLVSNSSVVGRHKYFPVIDRIDSGPFKCILNVANCQRLTSNLLYINIGRESPWWVLAECKSAANDCAAVL